MTMFIQAAVVANFSISLQRLNIPPPARLSIKANSLSLRDLRLTNIAFVCQFFLNFQFNMCPPAHPSFPAQKYYEQSQTGPGTRGQSARFVGIWRDGWEHEGAIKYIGEYDKWEMGIMRKQICSCFEIEVESGEPGDAVAALLSFSGVLLPEMGGGWPDSKFRRCSLRPSRTSFLPDCREKLLTSRSSCLRLSFVPRGVAAKDEHVAAPGAKMTDS